MVTIFHIRTFTETCNVPLMAFQECPTCSCNSNYARYSKPLPNRRVIMNANPTPTLFPPSLAPPTKSLCRHPSGSFEMIQLHCLPSSNAAMLWSTFPDTIGNHQLWLQYSYCKPCACIAIHAILLNLVPNS